jgi:hypothetical protein
MANENIPFQLIDWTTVPKRENKGETGISYSRTLEYIGLKIRMVEYSKDYSADHWCEKGHIVLCLKGKFVIDFKNAKKVTLTEGMSFVVSDDMSSHRSISKEGAQLYIIDGDFLKKK